MSDLVVKTVEELKSAPEEYREAVGKLVISHAVNELYGAQVFDEPAIAYAPTPYAKWLTCRVAMEEYGHHVRFKQLGVQMGIPEERMVPGAGKRPLSIFEFPLKTWEEFVAIKLLADLAEILQVEDLLHCTFHPLRNLARATMGLAVYDDNLFAVGQFTAIGGVAANGIARWDGVAWHALGSGLTFASGSMN